MKTFMLTKHTTEKNERNKIKKRDLKDNAKQKTLKKTKKIDENKPFKCKIWCCFFSWNKRKETRQEKTTKNKENKQENKEGTKTIKQGRKNHTHKKQDR